MTDPHKHVSAGSDGPLTEYQKGFMAGWDEAVRIFPALQSKVDLLPDPVHGYGGWGVHRSQALKAASQPSPAATVETPPDWKQDQAETSRLPRHHLDASKWTSKADVEAAHARLSAGNGSDREALKRILVEMVQRQSQRLVVVDYEATIDRILSLNEPQAAREDIAQALCGADGNGFLCDCTPTAREAYMIRADAVLALSRPHLGRGE